MVTGRRIGMAAGLLLLCGAAYSQTASTTKIEFKIKAQPMQEALNAFAQQSGYNVLFQSKIAADATAPSVTATLTPTAALEKLLANSGLRYKFIDSATVSIQTAKPANSTSSSTSASSLTPTVGDDKGEVREESIWHRLAQASGSTAQANTSQPPKEVEGGTLAEIIVTAQKREERLIDTPESVTVLSADDLSKLGAVQFRDWANTVPGLGFTTSGSGYTQISLRGVTTGLASNPTVGIYVDDVPVGSSSAFSYGARLALDVGLFDIQRIDVLRGPQGTLYGASTMGGLITYVSKRPDPSKLTVDVMSGVSDTQNGGIGYNGAIVVNAPLPGDQAAVRASAFYSRDGGYIDNVALQSNDVNRSGTYGGRLDFLYTPTEALTIRVGGFLQNISRDGQATADYTLAGAPVYGDLDQHRLYAEPFQQQFRLVDATLGYDWGWAKLTSISSYQTTDTQDFFDISALLVPIFGPPFAAIGLPVDTTTDKFTQEVRFASEGTRRLDWLIAGFYTHEASTDHEEFVTRDSSGQPGIPGQLYDTFTPTTYDEYAAFGNLTYHVTSAFDVSGGVRYARDRQVYSQSGTSVVPTQTSSQGVFTYLVDARYHFTDRAMGYLRYATGYRPGGPNYFQAPGFQTFQPDTLKSYETGFKAETANQRFGLDVAGYYIDWKNIQVITTRDGQGVIVNAPGGATIRGAELTLTARPITTLTLTGAFAYQDAHLTDADTDIGGAAGERLPNVPRFTAALNGDYTVLDGGLRPTIGATLRYVSDRTAFFNESPSQPQYDLPKYTTVDLRGGFGVSSTDVQLYVHNLADRRGQLSAFTAYASTGGPAQVAILQPRTFGISVTAHF